MKIESKLCCYYNYKYSLTVNSWERFHHPLQSLLLWSSSVSGSRWSSSETLSLVTCIAMTHPIFTNESKKNKVHGDTVEVEVAAGSTISASSAPSKEAFLGGDDCDDSAPAPLVSLLDADAADAALTLA